ncbi:hypothetical protein [uncultured Legionella sp.]|uniref:hypothetical protein n=1 Tax=uncultured Legionella sp. TaxID=210934 RepID=UPI0026225175|nr:hypothetical protein [uncultured Legionella sp.]
MKARKEDLQENGEKLNPAKITNFFQENNESKHQVTNLLDATESIDQNELEIYMAKGGQSYHPTKPPTFTKEQIEYFAECEKNIRRDDHNIRFDKRRQMYFFLPKEHPEYKEHPEDVEENNNYTCNIQ